MNPSIPAFTPRVLPLNYDALKNAFGCQPIAGNSFFAQEAFIQVCVVEGVIQTAASIEQDKLVSYCVGPTTNGVPQLAKFTSQWVAWLSDSGIRVSQQPTPVTLPNNGGGQPSSLFPTQRPTQLSIGFTSDAMMALAIEQSGTITLCRFTSATTGATASYSWQGVSPQLWNDWLLYYSDQTGGDDLVCFYLNPAVPNTLFARFQRENFGTEHIIHSGLPIDIAYLDGSQILNPFKQILTAKTTSGDDATFYSAQYAVQMSDQLTATGKIKSGIYALSIVPETVPLEDQIFMQHLISSGAYVKLKVASTINEDAPTLTAAVTSGIYQ